MNMLWMTGDNVSLKPFKTMGLAKKFILEGKHLGKGVFLSSRHWRPENKHNREEHQTQTIARPISHVCSHFSSEVLVIVFTSCSPGEVGRGRAKNS